MSTTKQLIRTSQVQVINLDNPNISIAKACELMKKLTVVAVSSICYMRAIFPDKAFNQRKIDDMPVKVLHGVTDIPGTYKLISWIKSAFEAVKDNYLKKMILLLEKPDDESTLETYTFRFTYNKEAILYSLQSDSMKEKEIEMDMTCPENVKKMAKLMLRSLFTYMSTLKPLPNGCELGMRLEFYDNVPVDYVLPENFKAIDSLCIKFPDEASDMLMGEIESKFTTMIVVSKSVLDPALAQEEVEKVEENECEDDLILPSQEPQCSLNLSRPMMSSSVSTVLNPQLQVSTNPGSTDSSNTTKLSEVMSKTGLEDRVVRCICGCSDELGDDLKCESCFNFQHRACYKVLENQLVPRHICIECYEENRDSETWVHPDILNDENRKDSALYRRALVLCLGKARVSVTMLVNELKIKRGPALDIFNRLGADGCLSSPSGKGFLRTVKTDFLKRNIFHQHFSSDNVTEMDTDENNSNLININNKKRKASVSLFEDEVIREPVQRQKRKMLKAGNDENVQLRPINYS